ncbi:MAG: ISAs1 family transposase, partial [Rhodobacteraceae bacterium]|nr:ISAs1 family transposase [Paracoccaceae bacterium]
GRSKEEFLRRFMRPEHGIPSHDAFSALFRIIDPDSLGGVLTRLAEDWSRRLGPDVIAIDGKTLRRSFEDASERVPLHVVSAFAAGARLTLGQVKVDGKSSEITAMPALPALPDIRGGTVTADAMHTLRPTAEEIIAKGGGCALALRGEQGALRDDVRFHMADPEYAEKMLCLKDAGRDHGRIEIREATVCHDIDMLQDRHHWPGLQAVGKVTAVRENKRGQNTDTRHFLLSEKPDPERFLRTVRSHRAVENSLHRVLDVTMGEDSLRNRRDNGPENPALMRKPALNPARVTPTAEKESMRGRLMRAGWDNDFLLRLISSASNPAKDAKPGKIQTR